MGKPIKEPEIGRCCFSCGNNIIGWFCDESKQLIEDPRGQGKDCKRFIDRPIGLACTKQEQAAICCQR